MLNDLRFAFRMIATHRWFSLAVVVTLALGIGINTTVFTLVNAVLFKPVPIPGGERIVTVCDQLPDGPERRSGMSWPDYLAYKAQNRTFEGLEAVANSDQVISENGIPPERVRGAKVSAGLFGLIKTPPILGRDFTAADGKAGAEPVLLLGYGVWQRRYHGALDVVGRAVRVNGVPATIVGVMPEGFRFPSTEDAWMPLVPDEDLEKRTTRQLTLFGLVKPGVSAAEAGADLGTISGRIAAEFPDTNKDRHSLVRTFQQTYNGDQIRAVFLMMLGAVGFVLLIACANVANMLLSRAITRGREISIRSAMGATRWQLVRQLLIECVLLSSLGGLLGLALSAFGVHAFDLATQDVGKPYWVIFTMDWRAFGYFAVISVGSGIVFGLVPALRATRVDLNTALKDGTTGGGGHRGGRLTAALVVFQFALTVVLLAGAGLMMRSFFAVQAVNAFVPAESMFTARIQLPEGKGERYETPLAREQFFEKLLPELRALPGVKEVAVVNNFPGFGAGDRDLEFEGRPNPNPKQPPQGAMLVESSNYLAAIGVPLLQGRSFSGEDGAEGKEVAIISRTFAEKHWPGADPLGRRFRWITDNKPGPWLTVIGICADVVQELRDRPQAQIFHVPYRQQPWGWMGLLIRAQGDPTALTTPVRAVVQKLDQDLPLFEVGTLAGDLEHDRWFLVVFGTLFLSFALTGLLMASVGIYAVVAQATARRTREIGVRMALGATARHIAQLVLQRGLFQLGLGLGLGLVGAIGATTLLAKTGLVLRVSAADPLVFTGITALLVTIGLTACWLPARRAARINPTEALRTE
ncbi:MAG TPA: ABC transporter permease [Lacunisphaera sp.]|nr:ABC transporter permease [Lacunisphaera sp.]